MRFHNGDGSVRQDFIILGGGIAGLTAAYELLKRGQRVTLIEKGTDVGGLARTFVREGFRFDLGGHRFHSNNPTVVHWLQELLGDDLLTVSRVSHIFLNGRLVDYPLRFPEALTAFPILTAARVVASYSLAQLTERGRRDVSFEDWIIKRFGQAMYRLFFQPYTEKVWGIPGSQLSAEWASQRIGLPSMWQAIKNGLRPAGVPPATAVSRFYYPRLGFGMIPQALEKRVRQLGGVIHSETSPTGLEAKAGGFALSVQLGDGSCQEMAAAEVISTIPLDQLLRLLPPDLDSDQTMERSQLAYRGLICVFLPLAKERVSEDSWTYFPDQAFMFGRTHEPKNWSPEMTPDEGLTSLAVEIFAGRDEPIWSWPDQLIVRKVTAQLEAIGWITPGEVIDSWVLRLANAYPVYRAGYRQELERVKRYLGSWPKLHLIGRTGSFRYMNSDGVIEDVFQFVNARFFNLPHAVQPLAVENGRWV